MSGFDNEVIYGVGLDLSGATVVTNQLGTDGFLYIGNSSGNPIAALLTSSDSSITWTAGSGSLGAAVDVSNIPTLLTSIVTDSGTATVSSNTLTLSGGTGLSSSGSGSTATLTLDTPVTVLNGGTGNISYSTGSIIFSNGTILTQDNSNLFWDDSNNRMGIGTNSPIHDLEVVGHVGIDRTTTAVDTHTLEIIADAAGFGDFKALDIIYTTGALSAGEEEAIILVNIDETGAGGGEIFALEVLSTTEGTDVVGALKTGIGVNAIHQESGTFGNIDNVLNIAVDVTAAVASGGAGNISMFVSDNDTITMGDAAIWDETEVILDTPSSGGGVAPIFAFSTGGAGFTNFVPVDGTNGFRNTGVIDWDSGDLSGWATNASGRFEIRITRTRNSLSTTPIVDTLQLGAVTEFEWDSAGDVNLNSLVLVTDLIVAHGGTGASTLLDNAVLVGSGTSAITALTVGTNGQLLVGSTGADPVFATATAGNGLTATLGAGTFQIDADTASATTIGVATFDENDFTVTAGDAALAARVRNRPNYVENLGLAYNGGTGVLTIQGATTALSSTNPAFVVLPSKATPGLFTTYEITANQSFIDDVGVSEIIDNLFGLTTSVAYGQDLPFFIYAVTNDDEDAIQFMISRMAGNKVSPAAASIGAPDDAVADTQLSFWSIDNITETVFDANPCLMVGSFRMQMSASDDWTVQTLDDEDGIGQFQENRNFTMALATFGAATGTFMLANGGTAPIFSTNTYSWRIIPEGLVNINIQLTGDGGTDGSGSVTTYIVTPYVPIQSAGVGLGSAWVRNSSYQAIAVATVSASMADESLFFMNRNGSTAGVQHADFGNGNRTISLSSIFRMSNTS